jgi:2'-5' RNA ligase
VEIFPKKKIIELQQKIDQELLDIFNFDQYFSPHLTLGRVKKIKKKEIFESTISEIKIKNKKFEINKFYLIESKVTKDGSKYVILNEFNK